MLAATFLTISSSAISRYEFNDKTIRKRDFPNYDLVQTFQNVWNSGRPVRQMTLWGAFTYYGSKSTFGLIDQCNLCIANHQDPPGTNCQDSLEGLARNLAATVMAGIGIAYTNGWLGKREDFHVLHANNIDGITNLLASHDINVTHNEIADNNANDNYNYHLLANKNESEYYKIAYNIASNETGTISIQQLNTTHLYDNEKIDDHWGKDYPEGDFPNCHDQLVIDYCRNTNNLIDYDPATSVTWIAAEHVFEGDWRALYWKAYEEDDWTMSWRYYKVNSGSEAWWSECDTGK